MKPTLNEEIGMSQQAIDYVNSLEVKEPKVEIPEYTKGYINKYSNFSITGIPLLAIETGIKAIKNNIPEEIEKQRIRKQARNAWICVFVIIAITVILNYYGGK